MNLHLHTTGFSGERARLARSVWRPAKHTAAANNGEVRRETRRTATGTVALPKRGREAVALVITLLMLSVITFLTIAFLAMSQRNKSAVSVGIDLANARAASDAARARAQTEIIAQMLAHGDPLYYDWLVSSTYHSSSNFNGAENFFDPTNVNYDSFFNYSNFPGTYSSANYAQMIANLWYDPRPPVFVVTNQAYPNNYDFRFWVDINRNGKFETNGYQPAVFEQNGYTNGVTNGSYQFLNGEPEWIGILKNPLYAHSFTNQFIGRYAYLVLPIGKELDFNYIHNFLKGTYGNDSYLVNTSSSRGVENDGFARDQGIGSWELNLAGVLDNLSPWAYESNTSSYISGYSPYNYVPPNPNNNNSGSANKGNAFDDAEAILHYRYSPTTPYLAYMNSSVSNYQDYPNNLIDMYCVVSPTNAPFGYTGTATNPYAGVVLAQTPAKWAWPGSYQTNQFFDVQDLFDTNKTSTYFTNRMLQASQRANSYDRYTFQRLLSSVGMGSSPEYGVWVHGDDGAQILRTKMNINYDNTSQINSPNAPFAPMPTNLLSWTPIKFFMNAAELLLRSQTFGYTNYLSNTTTVLPQPIFTNFGVTEIPIYRTNAPGIRYNASVHRMLQLAANIYDATVGSNYVANSTKTIAGVNLPYVRHPSVFRPVFGLATNGGYGINIIGYVQMSNTTTSPSGTSVGYQLKQPFYELPAALSNLMSSSTYSNMNIYGIPWVVGANKGLPQFYQYSYQSSVLYERKLLFVRQALPSGAPNTNAQPYYTNQFYCMTITNNFGLDAWNPYPSNFTGSEVAGGGTTCYISNYITLQFTNNYNWGTNVNITNIYPPTPVGSTPSFTNFFWSGFGQRGTSNGFITFFQTNVTTLPAGYFSQYSNKFQYFTNPGAPWSNQFLSVDTNQTLTSPGYPVYNWTLNVTNHLVYALYDGIPNSGGVLLDFVNLGPFGNSVNIQQFLNGNYNPNSPGGTLGLTGASLPTANPWTIGNATPRNGSPMSTGLLNQIANAAGNANYPNNLAGVPANSSGLPIDSTAYVFGAPYEPSNVLFQTVDFVANDPIVHYTVDDLTLPNQAPPASVNILPYPVFSTTNLGTVNKLRYGNWGATDAIGDNMLFKDPLMFSATNWDFPTNKFPGVGWLGRVHRGTPWQTVYLKADTSVGAYNGVWVTNWAVSPWFPGYEACPETYPTNDWALIDLFTTAPDDNAARGLLSVNQTNDAAWAAVFAGVIVPTNTDSGVQIGPINDVSNLVDQYSTNGSINALRANYTNGIFHKVGDILGASALTTTSPFLGGNATLAANNPDEIVERIPQQVLSLLKVGEPQFVIWSWGQSLKPKGAPYLANGALNNNIYTNYEITGEVLTRTVCHVVHTNGLKMVIDSVNVESGSGN